MYRILIVEDDAVIAKEIKRHLNQWGYEAETVTDFEHVLDEVRRMEPQLILMDISLPFYNGYYWCSEVRKRSNVPVIFLSSASDNVNIVMAVNMGGDDFIGKPFDLQVLTAKIQAVLRRAYALTGSMTVLEHNGLRLNLNDTSISFGEEKSELTKNEYKILQILLEQHGTIVTRESIMERLWESDSFVDDNTLTVNMTRLRKHLEEIGVQDFITTKKGIGYGIL